MKGHRNPSGRYELLKDREWLCARYVDEWMSTPQIAAIVGCSHATVGNALREHNITVRNQGGIFAEQRRGQALHPDRTVIIAPDGDDGTESEQDAEAVAV